jgi:TatD DNase family protein
MYSESHCHLRDLSNEDVFRAVNAGVKLILAAGIDIDSSIEAVNSASKYSSVYGCVGIHPWRADQFNEKSVEKLTELSSRPNVVAISEIGLDYFGRRTPKWEFTSNYIDSEIQRNAMREQIYLARKRKLPVLVHDRVPDDEVLNILENTGIIEYGAAIHGFSKGPEYAERCVELGIYLSIGKRTIEKGEKNFLEAINLTPLDWILTETDTGDPIGVVEVAEKIGKIKGISGKEVGRISTENLKKLINL